MERRIPPLFDECGLDARLTPDGVAFHCDPQGAELAPERALALSFRLLGTLEPALLSRLSALLEDEHL